MKRSDAEIRQTQQTPPWMMQRVFGKNAEELAKSGRNNSRLTRLGFLLMRNGDVGGHDDVRDLLVRSWLKQKLLKRETSDPKEKTNAKEQLLRYWLKEKAVAKRGDDSDSIGDSDIDSDSDSGERRRLLVTMERRLTAEENGIGAVSNAGTWNTNARPRHNPSALKLTGGCSIRGCVRACARVCVGVHAWAPVVSSDPYAYVRAYGLLCMH